MTCPTFLSILLLSILLLTAASSTPLARRSQISSNAADVAGRSFDYVVVGGGTCGLTFAANLAKRNPQAQILVVEAGKDTRNDAKIKSSTAYPQAFDDPQYDWSFKTTVQPNGKSYPMHAGLGLGGSSSINGCAYTLPPLSQLASFLKLGLAKFGIDALFDTIKATQNYVPPSDHTRSLGAQANLSAHGTGGPITVGIPELMMNGPQESTFLRAQKEALNASTLIDLADGQSGGAAFIANTAIPSTAERVTSATAYIGDGSQMGGNVFILTETRATKMIYGNDPNLVSATGVELQNSQNGPTVRVQAKRVIVAAGAIRTPVFLEHSGIGDPSILKRLDISVKVNLPGVGKNLVEQQKMILTAPSGSSIGDHNGPFLAIAMNTIHQLMSNATDVRGYVEANIQKWAQNAVDAGASASVDGLLAQYRAMIDGIFDLQWPISETFFFPSNVNIGQQLWALLSFSRGYVHATSTSTWDAPLLEPRYWSASIDMDFQVAASRGARRVFQTNAMRSVTSGPENLPGFDASKGGIPQHHNGSTAYGHYWRWEKFILDTYESVWHPIGTAAMLPRNLGGVVDGGFKVYGTANVYVVDASILNMQQSTHLTSILYGLATKAAEVVEDHDA